LAIENVLPCSSSIIVDRTVFESSPSSLPVRCCYFNAQCLTNKFDDLRTHIALRQEVGIFCISETWLNDSHEKALFYGCQSYEIFRSDRDANQRLHGGVAALVRPNLHPKILESNCFNGDCECLWLRVDSGPSHVVLGIIYRRPDSTAKSDKDLIKKIKAYAEQPEDVILVGDFNLPALFPRKPENASKERKFAKLIDDYGFNQLVDEPTRNNSMLDMHCKKISTLNA
jgi:hypothetical protein